MHNTDIARELTDAELKTVSGGFGRREHTFSKNWGSGWHRGPNEDCRRGWGGWHHSWGGWHHGWQKRDCDR